MDQPDDAQGIFEAIAADLEVRIKALANEFAEGDDAQSLFEAINADLEVRTAAREFDNLDHSGGENIPNATQVAAASAVLAKARELRRILGR